MIDGWSSLHRVLLQSTPSSCGFFKTATKANGTAQAHKERHPPDIVLDAPLQRVRAIWQRRVVSCPYIEFIEVLQRQTKQRLEEVHVSAHKILKHS